MVNLMDLAPELRVLIFEYLLSSSSLDGQDSTFWRISPELGRLPRRNLVHYPDGWPKPVFTCSRRLQDRLYDGLSPRTEVPTYNKPPQDHLYMRGPRVHTAIMRVSKVLHSESLPVFYRNLVIGVATNWNTSIDRMASSTLNRFLGHLPELGREQIRYIHFAFSGYGPQPLEGNIRRICGIMARELPALEEVRLFWESEMFSDRTILGLLGPISALPMKVMVRMDWDDDEFQKRKEFLETRIRDKLHGRVLRDVSNLEDHCLTYLEQSLELRKYLQE